jgi:hypothetical protein
MSDTPANNPTNAAAPRVLYCRCAYAKVVPQEVKDAVLRDLCDSGEPFESVADLCEMSARRDPALARIATSGEASSGGAASGGGVKIIACYERAVRGLFHAASSPLPAEGITVLNMRTETAEAIASSLRRQSGEAEVKA